MRGRRYTQRRGPLVIFNEDNGISKAFRNIPGVETVNVNALNLLQLAPGGHLGRFVIWTQAAFEKLDSVFGTFKKASEAKKDYKLPQTILTNADLPRIINSDEIQSVVKAANEKHTKRPYTQRKNPLKNIGVMVRFNPYAQTVRRAAILNEEARVNGKAKAAAKAKKVQNKEWIAALKN